MKPCLDQSGKIRGPINVTAQNVSHWFQNRRRKDNHPEIEEKRVKKRSARMKRATPLDLTQHPMSSTYQSSQNGQSAQGAAQRQERDSDDDAGSLFIADKTKSDADDADDNIHYSSSNVVHTHSSLFRADQMWWMFPDKISVLMLSFPPLISIRIEYTEDGLFQLTKSTN